MDLNAVKMFVHVVRQGSLTGAAAKLKMPLPTLSRRSRQLEKQLDVDLLERSVHGTKLTNAGSRLYEIASRGIELLADSEQIVANEQAEREDGYAYLCRPCSLHGGTYFQISGRYTQACKFTFTQQNVA